MRYKRKWSCGRAFGRRSREYEHLVGFGLLVFLQQRAVIVADAVCTCPTAHALRFEETAQHGAAESGIVLARGEPVCGNGLELAVIVVLVEKLVEFAGPETARACVGCGKAMYDARAD
jgi:hypothetical protein